MTDSTPPPRFALEGIITINTAGPVNTSGAFCDLFTGTHPIAGKVALKKPRGTLCKDALMRLIEIEAGVWIKLNHPRILKFLGLYTVDEVIYFVSPFAEFGSLPSYLERFPDAERGRFIVEIAEGLAYLHQFEPGIIHGDVKGHNVLIASDHRARLCDFGLARHADARTATALKGAGSLPWQSPEILGDGLSKSLQSDVYAFGITIYEVLSGKVPYCDCPTPGNIIKGVLFSNLRPPLEPPAAPDGTSYMRFWSEATRCWADSPAERPSMADVLRALSNPIVEPEPAISQPSIRNGSQEDVSSLVRNGLVGGSRVPTSFQADVMSAPKRKAEAVDTSTLRASKRHRSLSGQTTAPMPHHLGAVPELHVSSSTTPEALFEPQRTSPNEPPEMDDQQIHYHAESHYIEHFDDLGECQACGSDFDLEGYCVGCGASVDFEYSDEAENEAEDAASDGDSGSSSECEECGSDFDLNGHCVGCGRRYRLSASPRALSPSDLVEITAGGWINFC